MARLPLRRNERLMHVLLFVVPIGLGALFTRIVPRITPSVSDTRTVFYLRDGVWRPSPQVPGGAWGLHISSRGAVWTIGATCGGLSRLDGNRWTRYGKTDFGSRSDWIRGGVALRDEEVWGATDEGVVRFDGQWWLFTGMPCTATGPRI